MEKVSESHEDLRWMRRILVKHFDLDSLRDLCVELDVDYQDLPSAHRAMARELVLACQRQRKLPRLMRAILYSLTDSDVQLYPTPQLRTLATRRPWPMIISLLLVTAIALGAAVIAGLRTQSLRILLDKSDEQRTSLQETLAPQTNQIAALESTATAIVHSKSSQIEQAQTALAERDQTLVSANKTKTALTHQLAVLESTATAWAAITPASSPTPTDSTLTPAPLAPYLPLQGFASWPSSDDQTGNFEITRGDERIFISCRYPYSDTAQYIAFRPIGDLPEFIGAEVQIQFNRCTTWWDTMSILAEFGEPKNGIGYIFAITGTPAQDRLGKAEILSEPISDAGSSGQTVEYFQHGVDLDTPHVLRIEQKDDSVNFYLDGSLITTAPLPSSEWTGFYLQFAAHADPGSDLAGSWENAGIKWR